MNKSNDNAWQQLDVQVSEQSAERVVIDIAGAINHDTSAEFEAALVDYFEELGGTDFQLDLSRLRFLDSEGIGTICRLYSLMQSQGHELSIANPSPSVRSVITLMRLDKFMKVT